MEVDEAGTGTSNSNSRVSEKRCLIKNQAAVPLVPPSGRKRPCIWVSLAQTSQLADQTLTKVERQGPDRSSPQRDTTRCAARPVLQRHAVVRTQLFRMCCVPRNG